MSETPKPPKDPELDAAVLRVPLWRALGLAAAGLILSAPLVWYAASTSRRDVSSPLDDAWLDGSTWRIVEIERRPLSPEGTLHFRNGRIIVEVEGCAARDAGYLLTRDGISFRLPTDLAAASPCKREAMSETWARLPRVVGLTRYATGLALTDMHGRSVIRLRR